MTRLSPELESLVLGEKVGISNANDVRNYSDDETGSDASGYTPSRPMGRESSAKVRHVNQDCNASR